MKNEMKKKKNLTNNHSLVLFDRFMLVDWLDECEIVWTIVEHNLNAHTAAIMYWDTCRIVHTIFDKFYGNYSKDFHETP